MRKSEIIYYETIEDLKQLPDGSVVHCGDATIRWFDGGIDFEDDYIKQSDGLVQITWLGSERRDIFYSWSELKENNWLFYTVDGNEK